MCANYSQLSTQWRLSTEPQSSLSLQHPLPSPVLWPVDSSCFCFHFPSLPAPYLQVREMDGLSPVSPSLCCTQETFSRQLSWVIIGLTSFLSHHSKDHSPLFSDVLCLETHCFIYIVWCFSRFGCEGNSSPCYSILMSRSAHSLFRNPSPYNFTEFLLVKTSHMAPLGYKRGGEI